MYTIEVDNLQDCLYKIALLINRDGKNVHVRGFNTKELHPCFIQMNNPQDRTLLYPKRGNNPFASLAETMWVLSGSNKIDWLSKFLPRAKDFSDDGCFSGDTKVSLLDGTEQQIKDLVGKEFWVYSYDKDLHRIVPGKAKNCRCTGIKKIYRLELDNGEHIKVTSNHKFLTTKDEYRDVKDLTIGDSLKPLYRRKDPIDKYEFCRTNDSSTWLRTHRLMCVDGLESENVHHKDENPVNNIPDNLEPCTFGEHLKKHKERIDKGYEEWKKTNSELYDEHLKNIQEKAHQSMKEKRKDPIYAEWLRKRRHEGIVKTNTDPKIRLLMLRGKITLCIQIILQDGLDFNKINYEKYRSKCNPKYENILNYFSSYEEALNEASSYINHKVVSIVELNEEEVYDFEVENYHNFALTAGVFVHNSVWRGGYGPRLRDWNNNDQIKFCLKQLIKDQSCRQAIISLWDPAKEIPMQEIGTKDWPCSNWLHFLIRNNALDLTVVMRSNDFVWGFSSINVYEWTVLQEIMARSLGIKIGKYYHLSDSMHVYEQHYDKLDQLIDNYIIDYDILMPKFEFGILPSACIGELHNSKIFLQTYLNNVERLCEVVENRVIDFTQYSFKDIMEINRILVYYLLNKDNPDKERHKEFLDQLPFTDLKIALDYYCQKNWFKRKDTGIILIQECIKHCETKS